MTCWMPGLEPGDPVDSELNPLVHHTDDVERDSSGGLAPAIR